MQLKPYQETTIQYGLKHEYCIYALSMGLGKSLCALETFARLGLGERLLVVCPGYLVLNWKNEISKFYPQKWQVSVFTKGKDLYHPVDSDIVIISYDLVQKAEYLFQWATIVVADECHYLKGMSTTRTKFFHRAIFENSVKRLLLLTGTPIKNRVDEFYSLISLCEYNPKHNNQSIFLDKFPSQAHFADYFSYRREYDILVRNRRVKIVKWDGLKNESILEGYLKDKYIRFGPEHLGLNPVIYSDIVLSDAQDPILLQEYERWQENDSVAPDRKAQAALDKAPITAKIVKGKLDEGLGPIIVFTDHRASAALLAKELGCPYIDGQTDAQKRWAIANEFQSGSLPCLVATVGSFSTGVNLTASNCMIFNDYPWVPGDLDQAIYRINRLGQTRQCYVIRILGSPQDVAILKAVESKRSVIDKVIK